MKAPDQNIEVYYLMLLRVEFLLYRHIWTYTYTYVYKLWGSFIHDDSSDVACCQNKANASLKT